MNLKKIFGTKQGLTPIEKQQLQQIDNSCSSQVQWKEKLGTLMPNCFYRRQEMLADSVEGFAQNPTLEAFEKVRNIGTWCQNLTLDKRDFELIDGGLSRVIQEKKVGQHEIIRGVLKRQLSSLEDQLEELTAKEIKEAGDYGIRWSASGLVLALQEKVLELRKRIAQETYGTWEIELKEVL